MLFLLLDLACVASVAAQSRHPYVGLTYSRIAYAEADVIQDFSVDGTENETGFFGGYRIIDRFAVEGSWVDLSGYGGSFTYDDPVLGDVSLAFNADLTLYAVRALGVLANEKVDLFAGLGAYESDFSGVAELPVFVDSGIPTASASTEDSGLTGIAGIEYRLNPLLSLRLEYEWFDSDPDVELSSVALGVALHFR
jgi:opacity protein-like surface antigen